jgi:hypothetical protein
LSGSFLNASAGIHSRTGSPATSASEPENTDPYARAAASAGGGTVRDSFAMPAAARAGPTKGDDVNRIESLQRIDHADDGGNDEKQPAQRQGDRGETSARMSRRAGSPPLYGSRGRLAMPLRTISIDRRVHCAHSTMTGV